MRCWLFKTPDFLIVNEMSSFIGQAKCTVVAKVGLVKK